jgi:hypothetical protein
MAVVQSRYYKLELSEAIVPLIREKEEEKLVPCDDTDVMREIGVDIVMTGCDARVLLVEVLKGRDTPT